MHILMLPSWYPASEGSSHGSFFREQAEALAEAGHRVGVIALEGISVTDARALSALKVNVYSVTEGKANAPLQVLRCIGLRPIPMAHALNVRALARRWEKLFDAYVREHGAPEVLHAHAMNPGGVAAARISRRYGIPYVVTEHRADSAFAELSSAGLARELRRVAASASARIAVSPAFAEGLTAAYGEKPWMAIPNLLPGQFENQEILPREDSPFVFGHVSDLHPHKRVTLLIEAFADAFGSDPTVKLRIAGHSSYAEAHKNQVNELGLRNVDFVGAVSRSEIAAEFSNYHAFVMPSAAESFGVVFWEALACGVPIIASATDGGRYAVREDTGLLVDIDDRDGLTRALVRMRAEAKNYNREKLRAVSMRECGEAEFVRMYTEVYAAAMNKEQ